MLLTGHPEVSAIARPILHHSWSQAVLLLSPENVPVPDLAACHGQGRAGKYLLRVMNRVHNNVIVHFLGRIHSRIGIMQEKVWGGPMFRVEGYTKTGLNA